MSTIERQITVSVIIPVYNAEEFIRETLDSLLEQTISDYEIICVNDGSTDGTLDVLHEYEKKNEQIRVIDQPNQGAAVARNRGMEEALGAYLSILDSDDLFEPNMLERLHSTACENDADIVVCRCDDFETTASERRPYPSSIRSDLLPGEQPFSAEDVEKDIFKLFIGWSWDKLFKTSFVVENCLRFQPLRTSNDMYFVFSALVRAQRIVTVDDVLIHHRRGIGGLSETREKSWFCFRDALLQIKHQLQEWGIYERYEQDYINYCLHASLWNYDTLAEPTKNHLREKLVQEWFDEFGISDKLPEYFYNKREYQKYLLLVASALPKVSIVIPSLNSAEYYKECIDSAIKQDMDAIEIICVDAGSDDGTIEIIQKYMKSDPRIRFIHSEVRSYGYQMNLGIQASRGEYLLILESDDYILPHACSYYYEIASNNDLDFVKSDHCMFYGSGESRTFTLRELSILPAYYDKLWNPSESEVLFYLTILTQPGLYRLSFIRENGIRYHESPGASYQDNGFWAQVNALATRAMFTHEAVYMLRRDNPNSSVMSKGKVFAMCDEYDYIHDWLIEHDCQRFLPIVALRRFGNYKFTAERIGDWHRTAFFERWAQDFNRLSEAGELDSSYFAPRTWSTLQCIMREGSDYYYLGWYHEARANKSNARANAAANKAKKARKNAAKSKKVALRHLNSSSFKLGHALLQPVRVVRNLVSGNPQLPESQQSLTKAKTSSKVKGMPVSNPFLSEYYEYYSSLSADEFADTLKEQLARTYAKRRGGLPDLDSPQTFNEKIQARKLRLLNHDLMTVLSDACAMRQWVSERGMGAYLPELYGVWDSAEEVDYSILPMQFELRCSHGPNAVISVLDKNEIDSVYLTDQLSVWLQGNFGYLEDLSTQYKDITPRVLAEELVNPDESQSYSVWCFNGKAELIEYKEGNRKKRFSSFYDTAWEPQPFCYGSNEHIELHARPSCLEEMLNVCQGLASEIDFVAICFDVNSTGKLYLRRFDMTPGEGYCAWHPAKADSWLGEMWD